MPENESGGNGQAPGQSAATVGGNGQAPTTTPANNTAHGTSATSGQNGQAPTATQADDQYKAPSAEAWKRHQQELDEARRDAAKYRDELKKRDDATLTAQQKLERDYADLQASHFEREATLNQLRIENAAYRLAGQLQVSDIGAVIALVLAEHDSEIKLDAAGKPENLDKLIKQVLADHPALAGQANGQQQRPGASSGGATNPGAGARAGTFTRQQIAAMTPAEYAANRDAIMEQLKAGTLH